MVSFSKLSLFVKNAYNKNLFVSNTLTCMVLLAVGDGITQYAENQQKNQTNLNLIDAKKTPWFLNFDWSRNGKMFALGTALGPVTHFWYNYLDKILPGRTKYVLLRKICLDQCIGATLLTLTLIIGLHVLDEQKINPASVKEALDDKFLTIYKADCAIWTPANTLNFYYVSAKYRVLYINVVTLFWNIIVSCIMFSDNEITSNELNAN